MHKLSLQMSFRITLLLRKKLLPLDELSETALARRKNNVEKWIRRDAQHVDHT